VRPNVDGNDLGFGHRLGLAAKAGAIRSESVRPKCCSHADGGQAAHMPLERFQVKCREVRAPGRRVKSKTWSTVSILSKRKRPHRVFERSGYRFARRKRVKSRI